MRLVSGGIVDASHMADDDERTIPWMRRSDLHRRSLAYEANGMLLPHAAIMCITPANRGSLESDSLGHRSSSLSYVIQPISQVVVASAMHVRIMFVLSSIVNPCYGCTTKEINMANHRKAKGDKFERELAAYFTEHTSLDEVVRTPLSGAAGGADLTGTTGLFVEAKRVEHLQFPKAMAQAEASRDRQHNPRIKRKAAIVVNRRSRQSTGDSFVLMRLDDFLQFYDTWLKHRDK